MQPQQSNNWLTKALKSETDVGKTILSFQSCCRSQQDYDYNFNATVELLL